MPYMALLINVRRYIGNLYFLVCLVNSIDVPEISDFCIFPKAMESAFFHVFDSAGYLMG